MSKYTYTSKTPHNLRREPGYYLTLTFMEGDADGYNKHTFDPVDDLDKLEPYMDFILAYFNLGWNIRCRHEGVNKLPNAELFLGRDTGDWDEYIESIWGYDRQGDCPAMLDSYAITKVLEDGITVVPYQLVP